MRTDAASSPASSPIRASERALLRLAAVLCALALATSTAAQGQAQPPSSTPAATPAASPAAATDAATRTRAREAFQRGVQASNRRDYESAAKLFREALDAFYAPATAYNLASALYELDQHVEAYNYVQGVLRHPDTPDAVRERARSLEQTLQLEVARLTIVTSGAAEDVSAHVDGQPLAREMMGVPQAVTPGRHEVAALRGEQVISRRELDIAVRTTALVDLSLIVTESPAPAIAAPTPAAPAEEPEQRGSWYLRNRKVFWISVAAGVAVVGGGVAALLIAGRGDERTEPPVRGDTGVLTW